MTTVDAPQLLTVPQVAAALNCSRDTVYRRVRDGELPAIRLGSGERRGAMLRIPRDDLVAFLRGVNHGRGGEG